MKVKLFLKAILRYIIITNLIDDFKKLRNSDHFNLYYYLENDNLLKWFRPVPGLRWLLAILHYLIVGGINERDPGPEFDSSWYVKKNPEVIKDGINPLIYHLKYGISNGYQTISSNKGKHVEFIGVNGSGKTTLYRVANEYSQQTLGYKPGPTKLWTSMSTDVRIRSMGNSQENFVRFLRDNTTFVMDVLFANKQLHGSDYFNPKFYELSLYYFSVLCSYYQAVQSDYIRPWCMIDEGFCNNLMQYITNDHKIIDESVSKRILKQMPKPDMLIYVNTDVDSCIQRIKSRKGGVPSIYRYMSEKEFINYLSEKVKMIDPYLDLLRSLGTNVVVINNNVSHEKSMEEVISYVSILL